MPKQFPILFALFACFWGCEQKGIYDKDNDTLTTGAINVSADETLKPLVDAEQAVFHHNYPYAKLTICYKPEAEVIHDFLLDSSRLIILSRQLNAKEKKVFDDIKLIPRGEVFAKDAVTFILNNSNKTSRLTTADITEMLKGEKTNWKEINSEASADQIEVVFDNSASSILRMLRDTLLNNAALGKNCYALKTNEEVIAYTEKHPGALGIIGASWISDADDTLTRGFLSKIKIAEIKNNDDYTYYQPYQSYIALKKYPFCRDVFFWHRDGRSGLGTGFGAFLMGEKGQTIVLKSGLLPANAPVRIVEYKQ